MVDQIDIRTLGQIILLQSTIHAMTDEQAMARFICRGLAGIEGVETAGVLLGEQFHIESPVQGLDAATCRDFYKKLHADHDDPEKKEKLASDFKRRYDIEYLDIQTILHSYGLLFIRTSHRERFLKFRPYLENTLNLVALVLENISQKQQLLQNKDKLERMVEERTAQLEKTVRQLEEEVARRKKHEMKLKQSDDIVNNIQVGLHIYQLEDIQDDRTLRLIDANRAAEIFTQWKNSEAVGKTIDELFPSLRDQDIPRAYADVVRSGQPVEIDSHYYRDERISEGYYSMKAFPLPNDRVGISFENITERHQARLALKASEIKYRTLFEKAADSIFIVDAEGTIVDANKAASQTHGFSRQELLSMSIGELLAPDEAEKLPGRLEKILSGNWINEEIDHVKKDGTVFPMEVSVGLMELENQKFILAIDRDITERKKSAREREQLSERLRQAQKMEAIGTLAGGIAHDFNNILAAILGYGELMLEDVEKGSLAESNLRQIYTAAQRARDLVKRILTFARQSDERASPLQVKALAKEALKLLRSSIPSTIEIVQNIQSDSLVMANPTHIHQIFMNLCTNAARAMEENGGVLEVSLTDFTVDSQNSARRLGIERGSYLKITVSDTGVGISPDIIDSIFEPYFTTRPPGQGTGMGLAVVHGIVNDLGGKIFVKSRLRKGTTFTVHLPATDYQTPEKASEIDGHLKGSERILFVDDEVTVGEMACQLLSRMGYSVTTKTSSLDAFSHFLSRPDDYDLVITDMTIPHMTGDRLAVNMMRVRPDIPVILITGYSDKIDEKRAIQLGIKALAFKPLAKNELAKLIREVLDETN